MHSHTATYHIIGVINPPKKEGCNCAWGGYNMNHNICAYKWKGPDNSRQAKIGIFYAMMHMLTQVALVYKEASIYFLHNVLHSTKIRK